MSLKRLLDRPFLKITLTVADQISKSRPFSRLENQTDVKLGYTDLFLTFFLMYV